MITPIFSGEIKDGVLILDREADYENYLMSLSGRIGLTVKKERKSRSDRQNAWYWSGVIGLIASECGYEEHERQKIHEAMKEMFLSVELRSKTKKGKEVILKSVRSTTSLNTLEFTEYIEKIRRWAASEQGIVIPDPSEAEFN